MYGANNFFDKKKIFVKNKGTVEQNICLNISSTYIVIEYMHYTEYIILKFFI